MIDPCVNFVICLYTGSVVCIVIRSTLLELCLSPYFSVVSCTMVNQNITVKKMNVANNNVQIFNTWPRSHCHGGMEMFKVEFNMYYLMQLNEDLLQILSFITGMEYNPYNFT